jgi:hypothetical protein
MQHNDSRLTPITIGVPRPHLDKLRELAAKRGYDPKTGKYPQYADLVREAIAKLVGPPAADKRQQPLPLAAPKRRAAKRGAK